MKGEHIMGKVISFRRRELVWEEYDRDWTEQDFNELKEWLGNHTEDPHCMTRYAAIKDISFDKLCDMFNGKLPEIGWKIQCGEGENSWFYHESIVDYITEIIREEAWDYGCRDSWGADDSEEEINICE
jgi:hypothetical protein